MAERIWFVVPLDAGWVVRERTADRGEIFPTRDAAIARAQHLARDAAPARYLVRRADGSIEAECRVPRHESGVMAAVGAEEPRLDEKAG